MAPPSLTSDQMNLENSNKAGKYTFALTSLTSLFFMWGFITCLNDILIPYLKGMFNLSYAQAMLVQFCFFGAYFIVSLPAGRLVSKIGYQKGIVTGLLLACLGCLLFYPAASLGIYAIFLFALFVLASGITVLQVSANPFVSVLGEAKTASSRLTLTQAFNSLGTVVAPFFGAWLILSDVTQTSAEKALSVQFPYLLLALILFILALIFAYIKLPDLGKNSSVKNQKKSGSAWQHKHLVLGAIAIFVYVGAEVGIGSFLINFITMDSIAGLAESEAAHYIAYYFSGALIGRFIGAIVMQKVAAGKALAFNAVAAVLLIIIAISTSGIVAMWAILLVGLCNSIMFPTIFTLAINNLKEHTTQGSGILVMAIVGGAILPLFQGLLADAVGVQFAFVIPLVCFIYIAFYGLVGCKPQSSTSDKAQ